MAEEKSGFFHGLVKVTGKTWHGKTHEDIIELPAPVTKEGVFHAFKSRHGDAIEDGFEIKPTTVKEIEEEAAKKAKEKEEAAKKTAEQISADREKTAKEAEAAKAA